MQSARVLRQHKNGNVSQKDRHIKLSIQQILLLVLISSSNQQIKIKLIPRLHNTVTYVPKYRVYFLQDRNIETKQENNIQQQS